MTKPRSDLGSVNKEIDRLDETFNKMSDQMAEIETEVREVCCMPRGEREVPIAKSEVAKNDCPYIRPSKSIPALSKPKASQDRMRARAWEYVKVMAENIELKGETIEAWLKPPLSGEPCHYWEIPVNKMIMVPRFVAEHLSSRYYTRFMMQDVPMRYLSFDGQGISHPTGQMIAESRQQRLDCRLAGVSF